MGRYWKLASPTSARLICSCYQSRCLSAARRDSEPTRSISGNHNDCDDKECCDQRKRARSSVFDPGLAIASGGGMAYLCGCNSPTSQPTSPDFIGEAVNATAGQFHSIAKDSLGYCSIATRQVWVVEGARGSSNAEMASAKRARSSMRRA
jgi:hypothetical protein